MLRLRLPYCQDTPIIPITCIVKTWLGTKPENDLRFQRVYVSRGGKYFLTVVSLPGDSRTVTVDVNGKPVGTMSLGNNTMASLSFYLPPQGLQRNPTS